MENIICEIYFDLPKVRMTFYGQKSTKRCDSKKNFG